MWQSSDKVKIVFNNYDYNINHNGKKYPMAFIVINDTQMNTAIKWASHNDSKKVEIIETENKDFTISLANAPERSYQGGKLSFCNCIFEKEGIPSFAVGINTDYLFDAMLETTVVNGIFKDKVMFGKQYNNTGIIVMNSPTYNELKASEVVKTKVNGKKTKNWVRGSVYATATTADFYLGTFNSNLEYTTKDWDAHLLIFTKKMKDKVILYDTYNFNKDAGENVASIFTNYNYNYNFPSRACVLEVIPDDENYLKTLEKLLYDNFEKSFVKNNDDDKQFFVYIIKAFYFYDIDPEYTKKLLSLFINFVDKYPDKFTLDDWNGTNKIELRWDKNNTFTFTNYKDYMLKLIDLI